MLYEDFNSANEERLGFFATDNLTFPANFHRKFELLILLDGEADGWVDGNKYTVHPGEALLIFPYQIHSYRTVGTIDARLVMFSPELVPQFTERTKSLLPSSNLFKYNGGVDMDFKDNYYLKLAYLYNTLGEFVSQIKLVNSNRTNYNELAVKMLNYINEHFRETCSLREIADYLGYNYSYLATYFKSKVCIDLKKHINSLRVDYACRQLIAKPNRTIAETAEDSGFSSLCTFNREFKRICGCTPGEYRRQSQSK